MTTAHQHRAAQDRAAQDRTPQDRTARAQAAAQNPVDQGQHQPTRAEQRCAALFRDVMAHVPSPVAVVTIYLDGQPHGTTVSAFMSLSVEPPRLLLSLDNRSRLLAHLHLGASAGVNILTAGQTALATHFARKDKDSSAVEWEPTDAGPPRLAGAHSWLALTVSELITTGDHTLVVGSVDEAYPSPEAPLVYWQRTFGTHTAVHPA